MLEGKAKEKVIAVYFIALATLMYYFLNQVITIPYTIPVRQIFVLLIIFSGFVCFLIRPNLARGLVAIKGALVLAAPLGVMFTVSLPIWFVEQVSFIELYRSFWHHALYANQLFAALVAAVFLYVFGEKGIWYNLIALLLTNFMMVVQIMLENGVSTYLHELGQLIITFAGETGDVIGKAEIHELAFCLGAYLIYMLLFYKKKLWFHLTFVLLTFCFLSAFKRIAIVAIAVAVAIGFVLKLILKAGRKKWVDAIVRNVLLLGCLLLVLYIGFVKMGGFHLLEEAQIDTMTRVDIYDEVADYYEFSPTFMGHGMGFLSYQLTRVISLWESAIHNDFLQFYIDLGFWGYILWLLSLTVLRTWYFGRHDKKEGKIAAFAVTCYVLILSTTDNTLNFQMFYTVTGLLIMGQGFDERVRETDLKLFGFVEERNRSED